MNNETYTWIYIHTVYTYLCAYMYLQYVRMCIAACSYVYCSMFVCVLQVVRAYDEGLHMGLQNLRAYKGWWICICRCSGSVKGVWAYTYLQVVKTYGRGLHMYLQVLRAYRTCECIFGGVKEVSVHVFVGIKGVRSRAYR